MLNIEEYRELGCVGVKTPSGKLTPCGKIPATGSDLCPRCQLVAEHQAEAPARRAEKARLTLEARRAKDEELACSPLAALNPKFDKRVQRFDGGYDEARHANYRAQTDDNQERTHRRNSRTARRKVESRRCR